MRTVLFTLFLILSGVPTGVQAFSTEAERTEMLMLLNSIEAKIVVLQEHIQKYRAEQTAAAITSKPLRAENIAPSSYYRGEYDALYLVHDKTLYPPPKENDHTVVWSMFRELMEASTNPALITEFRVFSDPSAEHDAFIEQIGKNSTWVLGFNMYDLDIDKGREAGAVRELLLHEYSHLIFHLHSEIAEKFERMFWNGTDGRNTHQASDAYATHPDNFVSEYAATAPLEDTVESFVHFVLHPLPVGGAVKDKKVQFFNTYEDMRDIRDRLVRTAQIQQ